MGFLAYVAADLGETMRFPIFVKTNLITILLLLFAALPITIWSTNEFEKTSRYQEEDINLKLAFSKANEMNYILDNATEKARNLGTLVLNTVADSSPGSEGKLEDAFKQNKDIYALDVYSVDSSKDKLKLVKRLTDEERFALYKYDSTYVDQLRKSQNFPLHAVAQNKIIVQNSSVAKGIPLFTIGVPLAKDAQGKISHIVIADYSLARLQKSFGADGYRTFFLVDEKGITLAHQDDSLALNRANLKNHPIVAMALSSSEPNNQTRFLDTAKKSYHYGTYVRSSLNTYIISVVPEDVILLPARKVRHGAFYFLGFLISISLLGVFIFSMTITNPIEKLASLIKVVAKGNFSVSARRIIRSHDEVGDLAKAFDNMTEGLKERDKVKTLFSKFHGSTIAEDLMTKNVGVGGSNKEVTVFFSDIRGFTSFSENRSPEEVVGMLNEYFAIMVRIIQQNHGIVDKFIGDAIMAVWGAPKTTPRDAQNAVRACLEMRKSLAELNERRIQKGQPPILIGMGLHTGPAISGTIGSDDRMEYTVIGDTVNMTSRIESSTKAFGTDLLVSEATAHTVESEFAMELAGAAEVKGKSEPLKLFRVIGYKAATGEITEIHTPYSSYQAEHAEKVKVA
jgi:adenylate cyclase